MSDKARTKILIDMDSLLDTRFGTITGMDVELSKKVLVAGWRDRITDNIPEWFPGFPLEQFNRIYASRNIETLATSILTMMPVHLMALTEGIEKAYIDNPVIGLPELVINIHPYIFNPTEKAMLVEMMNGLVSDQTTVSVISKKLEDLTPSNILANYDSVIMYHHQDWFRLHGVALNKKPIPTVTFFIPAVFCTADLESIENWDVFKNHDKAELIKRTMLEMLCVEVIDIQYFSILEQSRLEMHKTR